jgi:hypothetical protein
MKKVKEQLEIREREILRNIVFRENDVKEAKQELVELQLALKELKAIPIKR